MDLKLLDKDFRYFLFHLWKFLGIPEPTPVQYEIAEWFQWCTVGDGRKQHSLTIAFRGVGKSWIRTGGTLWLARQNPDWKFLLPSASGSRSADFTRFTRRIIDEWPVVSYLKPRGSQRDTTMGFDFGPAAPAQAPSVISCGIGGQMASLRADFIFPDDVEVPNNSFSESKRDALLAAWSEFHSLLTPGGVIHGQGTPQTEESIYLKLIRDRGYNVRFWPIEIPKADELNPYMGRLSPTVAAKVLGGKAGQPTDPIRFPTEEIEAKKRGSGLSHFRLHFMLDTSLSDQERFPLKTRDLIVMPLPKDSAPTSVTWGFGHEYRLTELTNLGFSGDHFNKPARSTDTYVKYQCLSMFIDPAGSGGDELAWCIMGPVMGNLFVPAFGGMAGGYCQENLQKLAEIAAEYKVTCVYTEDNMGDGMFKTLLQPVLHRRIKCGLEGYKVHGQKELRIISTLEPLMNAHRLVIDYSHAAADIKRAKEHDCLSQSLFYQMTHVTKQRKALQHDDRLDILASAAQHWVDSMAVDNAQAIADHQRELEDQQLKEWMEGAIPLSKFKNKPVVEPTFTNWSDPLRN